jgi:hypothetical protein
MGTSKHIDSSAAFLFDVPGSNLPRVVQERQIGGTSVWSAMVSSLKLDCPHPLTTTREVGFTLFVKSSQRNRFGNTLGTDRNQGFARFKRPRTDGRHPEQDMSDRFGAGEYLTQKTLATLTVGVLHGSRTSE